jgi:hypothetical protein
MDLRVTDTIMSARVDQSASNRRLTVELGMGCAGIWSFLSNFRSQDHTGADANDGRSF